MPKIFVLPVLASSTKRSPRVNTVKFESRILLQQNFSIFSPPDSNFRPNVITQITKQLGKMPPIADQPSHEWKDFGPLYSKFSTDIAVDVQLYGFLIFKRVNPILIKYPEIFSKLRVFFLESCLILLPILWP